MKRRIIIDIDTTINRQLFDATINVSGDVLTQEDITRARVHTLARVAVNSAFDSFEQDETLCTCANRSWYGDAHDTACELEGSR